MDRLLAAVLCVGVFIAGAIAAGQQGTTQVPQGASQTPAQWPLSNAVRERGSSVTGAYEGWFYDKEGSITLLVGYFNRNTKQELDIPVGPNNRVEPGGPDMGQPTHFLTGRQWGVFAIKVPKDFGNKKLAWTIVANGQTNVITLHTKPEWIVEPFEDPANRNTPPVLKFAPGGSGVNGPPSGIAAAYSTTVGTPLSLTVWASDEGPKVNVPDEPRPSARGRGRSEDAPPPPISVHWSVMRGPAAAVKFDNSKPKVELDNAGKTTVTATFSEPGDYVLRVQANDPTGEGGSGFQCCWTNAHVKVAVKPAQSSGQ
jgi:hypothetical protein